jgi:hypothetical protein
MKKHIVKMMITALFLIPMMAGAQSAYDKFFEKYAGQDGYTSVNVTKEMFQMFASMGDSKDTSVVEMKKAIEKLTGLRVLTCNADSVKPGKATAFYSEAAALFTSPAYKELMTVNDDGENVRFLTKTSSDGKISEMIMLIRDKHEVVIMSITGTIDLSSISKLSKTMNIHGLEELQKMKDHKK